MKLSPMKRDNLVRVKETEMAQEDLEVKAEAEEEEV